MRTVTNAFVLGIDVLPRSTIQTASANAVTGKINLLSGFESIVLALLPKRELPSRNQINAKNMTGEEVFAEYSALLE